MSLLIFLYLLFNFIHVIFKENYLIISGIVYKYNVFILFTFQVIRIVGFYKKVRMIKMNFVEIMKVNEKNVILFSSFVFYL